MANSTYAYFPGCSLHGAGSEYGVSTELVCKALGVDLRELPEWNCCGATPAHNLDRWLGLALPARNLRIVEEMGLDTVTAPCAACFSRLKSTARELADPAVRAKVNALLDRPVTKLAEVRSLVDVLTQGDVLARLAEAKKKPLSGLRVVSYYGCVLVRPPDVLRFDDCEDPQSMDRLVTALGGEAVPWTHKTKCCGAGMLALARRPVVIDKLQEILAAAEHVSADVFATACPMCHANLDTRQAQVNRVKGKQFNIPVLYFTQLIGLALGYAPGALQMDRHLVDPRPVLKEKGLA